MKNNLAKLLKSEKVLRIHLAVKLGVSPHTVNSWCCNARQFNTETALKIKDILGILSIDSLIQAEKGDNKI